MQFHGPKSQLRCALLILSISALAGTRSGDSERAPVGVIHPNAAATATLYLPLALSGAPTPAPSPSSEPTLPRVVGQFGGELFSLAVNGDRAYVGQGLRVAVLDVSDPTRPRQIAESEALPGMATSIAVVGHHLAVAVGTELAILDVGEGTLPRRVAGIALPGNTQTVVVQGTFGYTMSGTSSVGGIPTTRYFHVVDLSDPTTPRVVAELGLPGFSPLLAVAGKTAFVAEPGLVALDIGDPAAPRVVGTLDGWFHDLAAVGGLVYLSPGLRVVDAADPQRMQTIGTLVGDEEADFLAVGGGLAALVGAELRLVDVSRDLRSLRVLGRLGVEGIRNPVLAGSRLYGLAVGGLVIIDLADVPHPALLARGGVNGPSGATLVTAGGNQVVVSTAVDVTGSEWTTVMWSYDSAEPAAYNEAFLNGNLVHDAVPYGDFLYVATESGLEVVARHGQGPWTVVGRILADDVEGTLGPPKSLVVDGQRLYLLSSTGLNVLDLSDPAHPRLLGRLDYAWGNDSLSRFAGRGRFVVRRNIAYVAAWFEGLLIFDLSDPAKPTLLGQLKSRRFVWDVAVQGDRAFIAARPNQAGKDRGPDGKVVPTGVWVVDVSDPRQPRESSFMPVSVLGVASSRLAVEVGPPQLAFLKDMLYVAEPDTSVRLSGDAYNDRLWVIDLRQPDQPRLRAMMHLAGQTRDVATDGRELYVADRSAGLLVLEPPAR